MAKTESKDHSTAWTKHAPKGSLQDRINQDTGVKGSVGVTGSGALRVLESPQTANLKNPHKKQGGNDALSTGGPKRS